MGPYKMVRKNCTEEHYPINPFNSWEIGRIMVWLPRPIGHRPSCVLPARHGGRAHANPHSAHRAIGTLMTIPRFPSHPLHSRRPAITRVRNCFLAQMGVAHNSLPTLLSWLSTGKKAPEGPGHTHRTHVLHTYERSRPDQRSLTMAPPVAWHCLEPSEWTIARRSSMLRPHAHPSLYSASPLGVLGM